MATVSLSKDTFRDIITEKGTVIIDWWAPWCGPCRAFAPVFEDASNRHPDVTFAKVNTDEEQELAGAFSISALPTLMVFRDQVLLFAQPGVLPSPALDEIIQKVQSLDMDEIRQEIEAQEALEKNGPPQEESE